MPKSESTVTFVCMAAPEAKQVFIAGDFNAWDPQKTRMVKRNGTFRKRIELAPGEHEYKFIVDGKWQTDPSAAIQVHNSIGSMNSVIRI